jgi:hypothetical protein
MNFKKVKCTDGDILEILTSISDKEKEYIKHELAKRFLNIKYALAYNNAEEAIETIEDMIDTGFVKKNDKISFNFNVEFLINDVLEIVGGLRRKKQWFKLRWR